MRGSNGARRARAPRASGAQGLAPPLLVALGVLVTHCKPDSPGSTDAPKPALGAASTAVATPPARTFTDSATRCGECHTRIFDEWSRSAHSRSADVPAYATMRARAADDSCDACHVPLAGKVDAAEPSAHESVTCDSCHAVAEVHPSRSSPGFTLALGDNTKYAELCESKGTIYFHKTGCSPLHQDSRFCAGCHLLYRAGAGGRPLPVLTEYEEWSQSEYAHAELSCQGCHMPSAPGPAATGFAIRPQVHDHAFQPPRIRGLRAWLTVDRQGSELAVQVRLKNERGGHTLPTGTPGHQLVLQARVVDASGHVHEGGERVYTRTLVDSGGREVPFFEAVRLEADSRLRADETRLESFTLPAPPGGRLEVTLLRRELSPALAALLGQATGERPLLSSRVPLDRALPRNLEIAP